MGHDPSDETSNWYDAVAEMARHGNALGNQQATRTNPDKCTERSNRKRVVYAGAEAMAAPKGPQGNGQWAIIFPLLMLDTRGPVMRIEVKAIGTLDLIFVLAQYRGFMRAVQFLPAG